MKEITTISFIKMAQINPLDGKSNLQARRVVNNIISPLTTGIFSDQSWEAVRKIWDALDQANIHWQMTDNKYTHDEQNRPNGKDWTFKVEFTNNRNRLTVLWGVVRAAGAGSEEDPLSRYDLVGYVS